MSDSENVENKTKRQRKDVKTKLQFEFLTLLAKHFGHFADFAELEGIKKRIAPTKSSDKVTRLGKFL